MASLPSAPELLHAVLAMQLGLITLEDAQAALAACQGTSGKRLRAALIEAQRLSEAQDELVAKLVEAYLASHQGDTERSLDTLRLSPATAAALDQLSDANRHEATVSFDGSKTAGRRRLGRLAEAGVHTTASGERFRALKLHAAGGVGEVHVARDEQLNRDVALKQLQEKYADDPLKQQRFVLEGEVTGALEHPGIVPVYALGLDELGRPFYAMRFVRGESLRNAVVRWQKASPVAVRYRRDALELRRILARFINVCYAIEYAHSRGVIHRDIKPANVMLGKHGETYVVDWGMARVAGAGFADPAEHSEELLRPVQLSGSSETQLGAIMGTPAYMSPEQAGGNSQSVGFPSDIYSLGATLYYLLVGKAPFSVEDASPMAFIKMIVERQFQLPRSVVPQIPRELEAICLRAMATAPSDRYPSAEALAADVERWMADEQVEACPPTFVERLSRWGRAHRTAVIWGGAALLLTAIIATVAALAINEARRQKELLAERNLALAESEAEARLEADRRFLEARETVDAWLTASSAALQHFPSVAPFRTAMLERAAAEYEAFVAERSDDPVLQLERGRTLVRLGDLRRALADSDKAQAAYGQALEAFAEIAPRDGQGDEPTIAWADAQGRLALSHQDAGDAEAAEQAFVAASDRLQPLVDDKRSPTAAKVEATLAVIEINFGSLLVALGRYEDAEAAFTSAAGRLKRLLQAAPNEMENRANLAVATLKLGDVRRTLGDADGAAKHFAAAAQFYRAAADLDPGDPNYLHSKATAQAYLATAEHQRGQYQNELAAYAAAIEDFRRLVEAQPDAIVYKRDLAVTQNLFGQALRDQDDAAEALLQFEEAKAKLDNLAGTSGIPRMHMELAVAVDGHGDALLALDQPQPALAEFEIAIRIFRALAEANPQLPEYRERLAVALYHSGQALSDAEDAGGDERFAEASKLLDELLASDEAIPSNSYVAALVASRRGDALFARGNELEAAAAFQAAADHWRNLTASSSDPAYLDRAAWFYATCPDADFRDLAQALAASTQALDAAPTNARYRATVGLVLLRRGDAPGCLKALALDASQLAEADGRSLLVGALALHASNNAAGSRQFLQLGADWVAAHMPGDWDLVQLLAECERELADSSEPGPAEGDSGGQDTDTQSSELPLPAEEE